MSDLKKSNTQEEETGDFDSKQDIRKKQLTANTLDTPDDESETDSQDTEVRQSMTAGARALFNRNKFPAKLEDFKIKKMIGKGTFGKVYLVELSTNPGKLYAMKCIRKDIIIENEQMDNIQLEKDILYTIDHPFLVNMEYVFQNEFRIYFLMHFVKGGELFRHLVQVKRFQEDQAKFFAA